MKDALPATWPDYTYRASNNNYALKVGYGYNWVFAPKWILGVSESPLLGIQTGWIDFPDKKKTSFAFYNNFRLSVVWNNKQWFAGAQCDVNIGLLYDKRIHLHQFHRHRHRLRGLSLQHLVNKSRDARPVRPPKTIKP